MPQFWEADFGERYMLYVREYSISPVIQGKKCPLEGLKEGVI